jgi:hypothetical protein
MALVQVLRSTVHERYWFNFNNAQLSVCMAGELARVQQVKRVKRIEENSE